MTRDEAVKVLGCYVKTRQGRGRHPHPSRGRLLAIAGDEAQIQLQGHGPPVWFPLSDVRLWKAGEAKTRRLQTGQRAREGP